MDFLEGLIYMIWRGIAIGVIISAPMGPVGILCVQRTLEKGRNAGLFTGVGAALSDLFYCLLTGFGLSFIEDFLKENQNVIQICGSIVLVFFGIYLFRSNPARTLKKPGEEQDSRGKNVLSGFLFTFSNPLIIFLIIGLFARFNFLLPEITFIHYIVGFIFIIVGALMWWWVVTYFVDKVRSHFNLRSMWLINKIIGVIIMIFALVGVFTAVSGIASAAGFKPVCLNSKRGYGPLAPLDSGPRGKMLVIEAPTRDTAVRFLPLDRAEEFSFSMRCANIHNASGKKYAYKDPDGRVCRVAHVPWGVTIAGPRGRRNVEFRTLYDRYDEVSQSGIRVSVTGECESSARVIDSGVDYFTGPNSIRIAAAGNSLSVSMGNRKYLPVFSGTTIGAVDSLGIWVAPGGAVEIDDIVLEQGRRQVPESPAGVSHFSDRDVRKSYFMRSLDPVEGVWEVFDRMLEEDMLRAGGRYRLAVVKSDGGYDMIYLGGAEKMASVWIPGMQKGRLFSTPFRGVFDVEWLDPAGCPLKGEVKAQTDTSGLLVFTFPAHGGSSLRMHKIKE